MFTLEPKFRYRVREEGRAITSDAYLTRGQLNACETGRFIGFTHTIDHKSIDVLVECPHHDGMPWWDKLADLDESGLAECEDCGKICQPVRTGG